MQVLSHFLWSASGRTLETLFVELLSADGSPSLDTSKSPTLPVQRLFYIIPFLYSLFSCKDFVKVILLEKAEFSLLSLIERSHCIKNGRFKTCRFSKPYGLILIFSFLSKQIRSIRLLLPIILIQYRLLESHPFLLYLLCLL